MGWALPLVPYPGYTFYLSPLSNVRPSYTDHHSALQGSGPAPLSVYLSSGSGVHLREMSINQ